MRRISDRRALWKACSTTPKRVATHRLRTVVLGTLVIDPCDKGPFSPWCHLTLLWSEGGSECCPSSIHKELKRTESGNQGTQLKTGRPRKYSNGYAGKRWVVYYHWEWEKKIFPYEYYWIDSFNWLNSLWYIQTQACYTLVKWVIKTHKRRNKEIPKK